MFWLCDGRTDRILGHERRTPGGGRSVNTFHVVALGPSGAGKTVFLAALHDVLGKQPMGEGISAKAAPGQAALLRRVYREVVDPDADWPKSTNPGLDMREFTFDFAVSWTQSRLMGPPRVRTYPALTISYVDYAGEWIQDADQTAPVLLEPFRDRIQDAHALLGIIDGLKLLQYMSGDPSGNAFMADQFRPIVEFMTGTDKPIHFIITKWDLLEGRYTLDDVRTRLLESNEAGFRALVESRMARRRWNRNPVGTIRLIPVSSVGRLAALGEDWSVIKSNRARATQINVDVPLAAAVADVCDLAAEQLRRWEQARRAGEDTAGDPVAGAEPRVQGVTVGQGAGGANPDISLGLAGLRIYNLPQVVAWAFVRGEQAINGLGRPAAAVGRSMRRQVRRVRSRGLIGVRSREAALFYLAYALRRRLQVFEETDAYRASLLDTRPTSETDDPGRFSARRPGHD
jgi:hypothetical protein